MTTVQTIETPLGNMTLAEADGKLTELRLKARENDGERKQSTPLLRKAAQELNEYFDGKRKAFSVPLQPSGTAFQQAVWAALQAIPYGETRAYGEIARQLGKPNAARAVGMANNRNPLPVFIPCHRVIGANGKLVGYGGGLRIKEFLLKLETK
ncbi:MAG: methylated-DNA--[protein]-cysteine S-methyltransferase [Clostridiales bacterium]|nr:methylated-DNA--[protein]-cysteine S-methyltransferase [Clostridiales bacterium]